AMTSMLALGLTLEQVVPMVTSHCAAMLGMSDEIGTLKPGVEADVSVLDDERGRFRLVDNEETQVITSRLLHPAFCLRAGKRYDSNAVILPKAVLADAA
ncbi:MAG: amidohydrolase family protein, partial [Enhydrobacter sp.]